MSVPSLNQLQFKTVSSDNKNDNDGYERGKTALLSLFETGKANGIDNFVSILWDIYCQWKLTVLCSKSDDIKPKKYSFSYFMSISPAFQGISNDILSMINDGISEYYMSNQYYPIARNPLSLIYDSYTSYVKYTLAISQTISALKKTKNNLQFDFWIIPNKTMKMHVDDHKMYEYNDDIIMNIERRLNLGNLKFTKIALKNEKDMSQIGLSQLLSRKISELLKIPTKKKDNDSGERFVVIFDRRKEFYDFKILQKNNNNSSDSTSQTRNNNNIVPLIECDKSCKIRNISTQVYIYKVCNGKYGNVSSLELKCDNMCIEEELLYNTQQWLLPFCRVQTENDDIVLDGGSNFGWNAQVFLLSFHVSGTANIVKTYWFLNGSMMRLLPNNLYDIWPSYFYKNKDLKKEVQKMDLRTIQKGFKNIEISDVVFEKYFMDLWPMDVPFPVHTHRSSIAKKNKKNTKNTKSTK